MDTPKPTIGPLGMAFSLPAPVIPPNPSIPAEPVLPTDSPQGAAPVVMSPMVRARSLSAKAFARAYVEGKSIAECAQLAGSLSKPEHLALVGHRLLRKDTVKGWIDIYRGRVEEIADRAFVDGITKLADLVREECKEARDIPAVVSALRLLGDYRGLLETKVKLELVALPRLSYISGEVLDIDQPPDVRATPSFGSNSLLEDTSPGTSSPSGAAQ